MFEKRPPLNSIYLLGDVSLYNSIYLLGDGCSPIGRECFSERYLYGVRASLDLILGATVDGEMQSIPVAVASMDSIINLCYIC